MLLLKEMLLNEKELDVFVVMLIIPQVITTGRTWSFISISLILCDASMYEAVNVLAGLYCCFGSSMKRIKLESVGIVKEILSPRYQKTR